MMQPKDPTVQKVLDAVGGRPDVVRHVSAALAKGDVDEIRAAVSGWAGILLTEAEVRRVLAFLPIDEHRALAWSA